MKLILGIALALLSGAVMACPGMDKGKQITLIPQELQSPVVTQDQVDPKLLTQADKKELKQIKAN